ncbi:MAG: hypothetical protein KDC09_11020 [Bacteroidales bacterium]|nr:hypothetical protein [Bacteroidales bacterium]
MNKELYWLPGKCAYCNGKGKVNPGLISKVSPDSSYYTVSLSKDERRRIKQKDQFALERANNYNKQVENFIKQIEYLYFAGGLDVQQIVDFYMISQPNEDFVDDEGRKVELIDYITKVVDKRTNN